MPRYSVSIDANHSTITHALEGIGAAVIDLAMVGGGVPDLYVEFCGRVYLLEIKNRDVRGRLNNRQLLWRRLWRGRRPIEIESVEEALAAIGAIVPTPAPAVRA